MSERQSVACIGQGTPDTCPYCHEKLAVPSELDEHVNSRTIWRRHRRAHFKWGESDAHDPEDDPYLSRNCGPDDEGFSDECKIDTQVYEVTIYSEYRETIRVEANNEHEAEEIA